jgi:hypothetical protein
MDDDDGAAPRDDASMTFLDRLLDWARGPRPTPAPPPRHERREAARERAHETGSEPWQPSDRLDAPLDNVGGEDITPGTPGGRIGFG